MSARKTKKPPRVNPVSRWRRHRQAIMDVEVRLIQSALEPEQVLSREELARRTNASLWREDVAGRAGRAAPRTFQPPLAQQGARDDGTRPSPDEVSQA